ncbi:hypothetical protein RB620_27600 [Paenibacillus sp. LHD-117]|uniref:hypothetical protein n=1 Tax=Paenibacillus sp. LHD-117 TaxID=3071412 RepID=UPI0027DFF46C|nr:hypothetical protein [Paenibacillus sp. LHD-117]MDQ6423199.1 hypothetical protein [Paenibacillus sp. LHD-117]
MFRTRLTYATGLSDTRNEKPKTPFALLLLFALLVTASFAYQAGNNFELTASVSKTPQSAVSHASHSSFPGKHPSDTNALLPNSPDVLAAAVSLLIIYILAARASIFQTPFRQRLKSSLLLPLKFSCMYVDSSYPSFRATFQSTT